MTLIYAIAGFFGVCTVAFVVLCARAPAGEEIEGVGFRLTDDEHDMAEMPWPMARKDRER